MSFHVLGPLEVRLDGDELTLGGGKQRAVLAVMLLRAGEVVSVGRLVDEVWGDEPPPSAAHTLESYVSRLRQLLSGHGPLLIRRGQGYAIELGGAALDAAAFVDLHERASFAAALDRHVEVLELTRAALALWRGPALADVALASAGRAEADRLEELRLRTYELRFDAEVALGRHESAIGELRPLVAQNPYRERFVAQLMLSLYRCGRHAEALDVYEQTRRRLDDDLGLQPSSDLQQLSGQIVRQDPRLKSPARVATEPPRSRSPRSRRVATLLAGGVAAAAVMTLTASGSTPGTHVVQGAPITDKRVALVLPRVPAATAVISDPAVYYAGLGFREITSAWGHEAETFVIGESGDAARRARQLVDRGFDLVVVAVDGPAAQALAALVPQAPSTRFAFIGSRLADLLIEGAPNAVGYPFADNESAELAGYLSGLVPPRREPRARRPDLVSIVGPRTPYTEQVVAGFEKGAKRASPGVRVRADYVTDPENRTACEAAANAQVDAGSDVILALGSTCGSAALAVVKARGVWGIRAEDDGVQRGRHILGTLFRYWEGAVALPVNAVELDSFPVGEDVALGLADDYAVLFVAEDGRVSEKLWSKVVRLCSNIRRHTRADAP